jgi:hypothetical protein
MVRSPHRRPDGQTTAGERYASGRVDAAHLEGLFVSKRGKKTAKSRREHRLPRAGRTHEEDVMATRGGDLERSARHHLPPYVCEVKSTRNLPGVLS